MEVMACWDSGWINVNLTETVRADARTQTQIFKQLSRCISKEKTQDVLNFIAWEVNNSRRQAAKAILRGVWPVARPIPAAVLERYYKTIPKDIQSKITLPNIKEKGE